MGQALPFEELRVVSKDGRDVPEGEIGEIDVRDPHVIEEYYKEHEKNAEAIRNGWFHTQDLGHFDEDGFLHVIERKHNMIISRGENIYPKEVEDVLFRHAKVADAALLGLPDVIWGQRVCAAIVSKPGKQANAGEVIDFCKDRLPGYKIPKSVFLGLYTSEFGR
jgi:acyl-CoA synthetase (AMP-forming)/AMP-acid ligase II